ncbi:MAG: methionine--tRNA ligase [Minisyncoccia bacterium]
MENKKPFYITTTLPYVNAEAHMGHALEIVRADVIARYKKLLGYEVFFNTGTDEHGQKLYEKALEENKTPKEYTDFFADKFKKLLKLMGVNEVDGITRNFIRTTDEKHIKSAQEFWETCDKNGYIYKKNYQIKYCVGCELEKTDSDLVDGKCPDHPNLTLEIRDEENYFFKFSAFSEKLLDFYKKNPNFVVPDFRFNEIKAFVERSLQDFSISRLKSKMPWGIEVPGDSEHIMYVWFDALVNYVTAIGWPMDMKKFEKWQVKTGGMVQYCGKDNLRQQSAMWQAMLMACGLPNSKTIVIDGFVTGPGGLKMSKSLGNVVSPVYLIEKYGTDALRYFVTRELSTFEDSPMSEEMFKESYNANLANGLGNLVSRVMKMATTNNITIDEFPTYEQALESDISDPIRFSNLIDKFNIKHAMDLLWTRIQILDGIIQRLQPFKLLKSDDLGDKTKGVECIKEILINLYTIALLLQSVMPETAKEILRLIKENKMPEKPLFLRME